MTEFNLANIPLQTGRVAIVTGSNTGLGYETALGLAQKDATVVMACRSQDKAAEAREQIVAEVPGANMDIILLDLSDLSSVRQFADEFRQKYVKLDLLVNNAGIMMPPYARTVDGFESQLGANHLGHFLLTALLIDMIPDVPESRIVSLSSVAHKRGQIQFDDLHFENSYSKVASYSQSKLACLMFADELQRCLNDSGKKCLSVCAHPGASPTELGRHIPKALYRFAELSFLPIISHTADKGVLPTLMAALDPDAQGGEYFGPKGLMELKGKPGRAKRASQSLDQDVGRKLWEVSEQLTGCEFSI